MAKSSQSLHSPASEAAAAEAAAQNRSLAEQVAVAGEAAQAGQGWAGGSGGGLGEPTWERPRQQPPLWASASLSRLGTAILSPKSVSGLLQAAMAGLAAATVGRAAGMNITAEADAAARAAAAVGAFYNANLTLQDAPRVVGPTPLSFVFKFKQA